MRRKFRLLFRTAYRCTKEIHITDRTYKYLLDEWKIHSQVDRGSISYEQGFSIIQNIDFFKLPLWDGENKFTKSRESDKKLLEKIQPHTCITEIVNAIIALQRAIPQNQRFKLKKDCPRKLKMLDRKNVDDEE